MARKQLPTVEAVTVEMNGEALAQAGAAATELVLLEDQLQTRVRAVAQSVGYQLPADATDPDLIQRDIAANMRRSVEACLEVGRGLRVLKEACGHGNFMARLEVLGLEPHVASRFLSAAVRFSNLPTSANLTKAIGSQSKLIEMLVLDDGQLEELELTGQTGELALDDVATMSVKELRAAVREVRESAAAKQRLLDAANSERDSLKEKALRPYKPKKGDPSKSAEEKAALDDLAEATNAVDVHFARLGLVAADLSGHDSAAIRERAQQAVQYLVSRMREIVLSNSIEVRVDDETLCGRPTWLDGEAANSDQA